MLRWCTVCVVNLWVTWSTQVSVTASGSDSNPPVQGGGHAGQISTQILENPPLLAMNFWARFSFARIPICSRAHCKQTTSSFEGKSGYFLTVKLLLTTASPQPPGNPSKSDTTHQTDPQWKSSDEIYAPIGRST